MPASSTMLLFPMSSECVQRQGVLEGTQGSLEPNLKRGRLLVLTGPSGVGKGTVVRQLRQRHPELYFSVSVTTRSPRPSEQEGVNYFFRSREEFFRLIEAGELLEWAQYAGNFYGTPRDAVLDKLSQGQDVLLEIELAGARQVSQHCPEAIRIFLSPPSLQELERRIRERGQDSEASIERRLQQAQQELDAQDEFDYVIVNDDLEQALLQLETLLYPKWPEPEVPAT
ncbi:guanylate kinase [Thermostichus vulcanus]|uniref:Guanylate kinase n=1 Tax=Thermostichus vulcanus str. 'Rupite' TaxID=2813851 RepID=A0ABT0C6F8_THEVL|nr:guanylate kinase [Thermostichus vulcanus]MCJ2541387.1 guanylate kinase [Thermostichus vulcanus str. 'Rupite']